MARRVTLTITDDQEEIIRSCFAHDSKSLPAEIVQKISEISLDAWLQIFSGKARYRTLNELYLDWLARIFNDVRTSDKPSQRYLFQQLNFSHGQASYLARVLLDKQNSRWRELATIELRDALIARKDEAQEIIKAGSGHVQKLEFDLSRAARLELNFLLEMLHDSGGTRISPPQPGGTYGDRGNVGIVAALVPPLLKLLPEAQVKR